MRQSECASDVLGMRQTECADTSCDYDVVILHIRIYDYGAFQNVSEN